MYSQSLHPLVVSFEPEDGDLLSRRDRQFLAKLASRAFVTPAQANRLLRIWGALQVAKGAVS